MERCLPGPGAQSAGYVLKYSTSGNRVISARGIHELARDVPSMTSNAVLAIRY